MWLPPQHYWKPGVVAEVRGVCQVCRRVTGESHIVFSTFIIIIVLFIIFVVVAYFRSNVVNFHIISVVYCLRERTHGLGGRGGAVAPPVAYYKNDKQKGNADGRSALTFFFGASREEVART